MRPSGVAVVALLFGAVQIGGQSIKHWAFPLLFPQSCKPSFCLALLEPGVLSRYRIVLDANTRSIKKEMSDD